MKVIAAIALALALAGCAKPPYCESPPLKYSDACIPWRFQ